MASSSESTAGPAGKVLLAEGTRLAESDAGTAPWRDWGPYLSERAWGSVREDYSANGDAWDFFPHDHARSRVYRWNEDGMAGFCDATQNWCLSLALWNGVDPILKERMFGLTGPQGNYGEDVKEYWWVPGLHPTHSWNTWRLLMNITVQNAGPDPATLYLMPTHRTLTDRPEHLDPSP